MSNGIDPKREAGQAQDRLLGWSFQAELLDPGVRLGRDLSLVDGPNGLDFSRSRSLDALTQALAIALTTRLGDDIFNVAFGFDGLNALAEESNTVLVRERIRIAIIQVLRKEPRVRQIIDVKLAGGQLDTGLDGNLEGVGDSAMVNERRELNVAVAFQMISGGEVTLNLGTVGIHG